ncbi:hypothetical protein FG386_002631 [Cryptosporidium ryanae]|uniref:uncharacterized protein n=1 Tax=Cryptosporidium ryanae TaxID=515981 RepID=UPI003519E7A9|nr:hypothetical protein FG386_002631 [Cryptosporidium ryanae]
MITKLRICFIIIFTIIVFYDIDCNSRCNCSELAESAFTENDVEDSDEAILQQNFTSSMKKEINAEYNETECNSNSNSGEKILEGKPAEESSESEQKSEKNEEDVLKGNSTSLSEAEGDDSKDEEENYRDSKNKEENKTNIDISEKEEKKETNLGEPINDKYIEVMETKSKIQNGTSEIENDSGEETINESKLINKNGLEENSVVKKQVNKSTEMKEGENKSTEDLDNKNKLSSELSQKTALEIDNFDKETPEGNLNEKNNTNSIKDEITANPDDVQKELEVEKKVDKLSDIERVVKEMKEELTSKFSNETEFGKKNNNYIITIKRLDSDDSSKEKNTELNTNTKETEIKMHKDENNDDQSTEMNNNNNKPELNNNYTSDSDEYKSNKELIEKLMSLSPADNLANENEHEDNAGNEESTDKKMEALIQEKKDYDAKKMEKENQPLQKKKKWYEKRDPVTGELLFDVAALSRNITAAITAKRKKGSFSKCFQFHGQKEKCDAIKNCFYDDVYDMCLLDCSLLNKKDACEEYLECRFDYVVPRKACVNDCFQSRDFMKQDLNGVMRGCMWCSQEIMCNTIKRIQNEKFPDFNNRKFDCNWQAQNGLDVSDEDTENSICVDRNFGRTMTDKDLVAANYISTQTKLTNEAAEKIKQQMLIDGESEEFAKLQTQNINILKRRICYPPNIPFSKLVPEKKYYINEEEIEIVCDYGYKVTGASDKLKCVNGEFSPKVFCIAYKEIEKQKESIGKHFNNIFNLLVNSVFGGGRWIDFGIEKINESRSENGKEEFNETGNENLQFNETNIFDNKTDFSNNEFKGDVMANDTSIDEKEDIYDKSEEDKNINSEHEDKNYTDKNKLVQTKVILNRVTGDTILDANNS